MQRRPSRQIEPASSDCRYRACIDPVPQGVSRPLWSVMIPTYHCARYLPETLAGVLAQDQGPDRMQIEIVDDHSTADDPQEVVARMGNGRVGFYRQSRNVGHTKNFATCIRRARGHLVHLLHGDDGVRPGFYRKMQQAFERNASAGAAFCRQIYVDEEGHWKGISPLEQRESGVLENWLERLSEEQRIMTPSIVVRRDVYEELGGFDARLVCAEDWEMWVRIASRYPVWYEVEPLALYRMHTSSNTGRHIRSGEDVSYTCQAIDLFGHYLPEEIAGRVKRRAKETYAFSALRMARAVFAKGDREASRAQVRAALSCSRSVRVQMGVARLALWATTRTVRRALRDGIRATRLLATRRRGGAYP